MPKVPEHEWGDSFDPESEEHSPTSEQIRTNKKFRDNLNYELWEIESRLGRPNEDPFTGEESKFSASDPESVWIRLGYLRTDLLENIKDPEIQSEIEKKITEVEKKVYKQFIPFIDSRINLFGLQNSPLEDKNRRYKLEGDEIVSSFREARSILKHFRASSEEHAEFLSELDRLQQKFERYSNEPTLFTFESMEGELQKEIYELEFGGYYIRRRELIRTLDGGKAQVESQAKFDSLLSRTHRLIEIAEKMSDPLIKMDSELKSKFILERIEYLKAEENAPRDILTTEAELRDLVQRMKGGEKVEKDRLDSIGTQIDEIKKRRLGYEFDKIIDNLDKLFTKAKRLFSGENLGSEDEIFEVNKSDADWAWNLLGIERDASEKIARDAYKKLARRYHPDINKQPDVVKKM